MLDRAYGALVGGAIGDAMGMPASFLTRAQIIVIFHADRRRPHSASVGISLSGSFFGVSAFDESRQISPGGRSDHCALQHFLLYRPFFHGAIERHLCELAVSDENIADNHAFHRIVSNFRRLKIAVKRGAENRSVFSALYFFIRMERVLRYAHFEEG